MRESTQGNIHQAFFRLEHAGQSRFFTGSIDRTEGTEILRRHVKNALVIETALANDGPAPEAFSSLGVKVADVWVYRSDGMNRAPARGVVYTDDLFITEDDVPGVSRYTTYNRKGEPILATSRLDAAEKLLHTYASKNNLPLAERSYEIELSASFTSFSASDLQAHSLAQAVALARQETFSDFNFTMQEDPLPDGEEKILVTSHGSPVAVLIDARETPSPRADVASDIVERLARLDPLDQIATRALVAEAIKALTLDEPQRIISDSRKAPYPEASPEI